MRIGTLQWAAAILVIAVSWCAAQDRPKTLCSFDGFSANPILAEIATAKTTVGYIGCSSGQNCLSAKLAPGDPVVVYQAEGDWTCGYLSQAKGAGPGWVRSNDIRPVHVDAAPPLDAWVGTWANGDDRIRIQTSKAPGKLELQGEAVWHGRTKDAVHTGDFSGAAAPVGSHLHFVESGADSCTIDLTLIGKYLVANDNNLCGGENVRFWGIWKRAR
jgi:hypothetical protein